MRNVPVVALGVLLAGACILASSCRKEVPPPPPPPPAVLVPPLHDCEAGEELRLRRGNEDWVWRVASTTDAEVDVEFTVRRADGTPGQVQRLRWSRNAFGVPDEFVIRECARDRIEVSGRTWDCWRLRVHSRTGVRYYWITEELPVHGVLRMAVDDRGQPAVGSAADVVPDATSFGK